MPVILIAGFGTAPRCVLKRQHHFNDVGIELEDKNPLRKWLTESTVRKIWFYVLPLRLLGGRFSSNACDDLRNKKQKFSLLPDHRLLSARLADECHMLLYVLKAYHVLFFSCLSLPPQLYHLPPRQSHRKTFNEKNFPLSPVQHRGMCSPVPVTPCEGLCQQTCRSDFNLTSCNSASYALNQALLTLILQLMLCVRIKSSQMTKHMVKTFFHEI